MKKLMIFLVIGLFAVMASVSAQPGFKGQGNCDGNGPKFNKGMNCNQGPGGRHGGFGKGMRGDGPRHEVPGVSKLLRMGDELGLTEAQIDKLETMQEEFAIERIDLEAEIKKAEVELRSLIRDEASDRDVFAAMDKLGGLKTDKKKMHYTHYTSAKDVLTDEQIDKLKELRKERMAEKKENRQNFGRRGFKNKG